jgi:gluconolactonase
MKVEILAEGLDFPEGPAFAPNGELWCVEVMGGNLVRWSELGIERFATGGAPNGLAFDRHGLAWFCDAEQCAIRTFDPTTQQFQTVADSIDGHPLFKPNDLAFDARGNLLFTCPGDSRYEPTGYVCCLSTSGELTKIADRLYFPNGLALVDEGRELVVAETFQRRFGKGAGMRKRTIGSNHGHMLMCLRCLARMEWRWAQMVCCTSQCFAPANLELLAQRANSSKHSTCRE